VIRRPRLTVRVQSSLWHILERIKDSKSSDPIFWMESARGREYVRELAMWHDAKRSPRVAALATRRAKTRQPANQFNETQEYPYARVQPPQE